MSEIRFQFFRFWKESLHRELKCSWVKLHNYTGPCLCISLCRKSSGNNNIQTSVHQQHYSYNMKPHWSDGVTKPAMMTVLFGSSSFLNSSVLSGWFKKAMVTNLSMVSMHLMSSFSVWKASNVIFLLFHKWAELLESHHGRLSLSLLLHPGLRVDGPVDDVEEDVRPWKHNSRVLVYGVGVYPNVHVASGWLHLARELRVIQCHLRQHSLLAAAVLWHPIIPCGVDIHRPVASDLGVDHHLIRVANATSTRQLERNIKSFWHLQIFLL